MESFWTPIIAAVATVVCNAVYLAIVKKDIDKQIEQYKIAYSGVFKEKVEYYKQLLVTMDELRDKVVVYGHAGRDTTNDFILLRDEFNNFARLNTYGSMFYSRKIESIVENIRNEFHAVFQASTVLFTIQQHGETNREAVNDYIDKLSNLTSSKNYGKLRSELIKNIRKDFGYDD